MITNSQQEFTDKANSDADHDIQGNVCDENTRFAELLADQRKTLTKLLAALPVTSLWILTKHGHFSGNTKEELKQYDNNQPLESIQTCFLRCYHSAKEQGLESPVYQQHRLELQQTQLDTPFIGEDINNLCAFVLQLCTDDLQPHGIQAIKTPINPAYIDLESLVEFYQREIPNFLCHRAIASNIFLKALIDHYRRWSRVRQQFANHNLGLVRLLKQQYKGDVLSEEDLLQEGLIGLLKAIDRFDHQLGFKFSTYATYWIRQAMSRSLTRGERTVRLPFAQMTLINKLCRAREKLLNETGREPSDPELAEQLKWRVKEVSHLQNISQVAVSLDETFDYEKNNNLQRYLQQECHESPLKQHSDLQLQQLFSQALLLLNTKERLIICWRFGFNGSNELTLEEIGKQLDLTRERVRQIQVLAMEKIKYHYGAQLKHFLA